MGTMYCGAHGGVSVLSREAVVDHLLALTSDETSDALSSSQLLIVDQELSSAQAERFIEFSKVGTTVLKLLDPEC